MRSQLSSGCASDAISEAEEAAGSLGEALGQFRGSGGLRGAG